MNSLNAKDAKTAKENKNFNAKDAKTAKENKSFNSKPVLSTSKETPRT